VKAQAKDTVETAVTAEVEDLEAEVEDLEAEVEDLTTTGQNQ